MKCYSPRGAGLPGTIRGIAAYIQIVNAHMKRVKQDKRRQATGVPAASMPAPPKRKVAVMADVAELAGVSYQTVSRVLHDSPSVHAQTRERVLAAIRRLDYRPNSMARALVTGRSKVLGVVSFDTTLYGPASTLFGIQQAAHDAGYAVSIESVRALNRETLLSAIQRLRDQGVDGVAVIAPLRAGVDALRHLPADCPVVAVEAGSDASVPVAAVDQQAGAAAATQHLLSLGHKTVWHLAGPLDWKEAEDRVEGWKTTLQAAGAPVPALIRGDWTARSGYEAGRNLIEIKELTAVLVGNDQMALGLLRRLHELERRVPAELSVVGFDDIPEAAYFTPPLTTVRQDFTELGRRCLHALLDRIAGNLDPIRLVVAPELVVRGSTGRAPR